jgi:hypothetical protein
LFTDNIIRPKYDGDHRAVLSKSHKTHNRLYNLIKSEELNVDNQSRQITPRNNPKTRERLLAENLSREVGWDVTDARKI